MPCPYVRAQCEIGSAKPFPEPLDQGGADASDYGSDYGSDEDE